MPTMRVVMPNGTTRSFREGTPRAVIRRAQAAMLADMKASGDYDGFDFSEFERPARKVQVTQFGPTRILGPDEIDPNLGAHAIPGLQQMLRPFIPTQIPRPRPVTRRDVAEDLLQDKRVAALLATIRGAESEDRYDVRNGGATFTDYAAHPGGQVGKSSAAGAYQIIEETWQRHARALGLQDFSPVSQDLAAVDLLKQRGAIDKLLAGDLDGAIYAAGKEWDALPINAAGDHISKKGGSRDVNPLKDAYNKNLR